MFVCLILGCVFVFLCLCVCVFDPWLWFKNWIGGLWSRVVPLVGAVAYEFQCPPCQPPNLILTTSEDTTNVDAT